MLSFSFRPFLLAACLASFTTACADDGEPSPPPAASAEPPDHEIGCNEDARRQTYEPGLAVTGARSRWTFVLEAAEPAPPAKGLNRWLVAARSLDGTAEVEELEVAPFMPDHDHGPARAPKVERDVDGFVVDDIDLFMPGLWRVTLTGRAQGVEDTAEFFFCVEG